MRTINESYLSFEEDVMAELKETYKLSSETGQQILETNKFKERYMRNPAQFDYMELEEIARDFYKTYNHLKNSERH